MKRIANLNQERKLKKQGYKYIAGVDEVGLGAWAGPIFAAAIILSPNFRCKICDSKQLLENNRGKLAKIIKKKNEFIGIGRVEKEEIDTFGLAHAKRLVVKRALKNLSQKPDYVLFDGIDFINPHTKQKSCDVGVKNLEYHYKFIIKGDEKIKSIACASIIAKVERDKIMRQAAKNFPNYKFDKNKGYGTLAHQKALTVHGLCELHRISYEPIKRIKNNKQKI